MLSGVCCVLSGGCSVCGVSGGSLVVATRLPNLPATPDPKYSPSATAVKLGTAPKQDCIRRWIVMARHRLHTHTYNYATGIAHKTVCQTGIFCKVLDSITREAVDTPSAPLWWLPTDVTIQHPRSYHLLGVHFGHECTPGDI